MKDDIDLGFFFNLFDSEAENSSQREKFRMKEGERREVCILFADVKNSTVLGSNLGIWYQHHKQYDLAFQHHHSSLNYATELNDSLRVAKTYCNLGLL